MVSTHVFNARGPRFESGHFWFYFFVYFCPRFLLRQEFRQRFLGSLWSKLMASMVKSRLQKLLCEMAFKSLCKLPQLFNFLWILWPKFLLRQEFRQHLLDSFWSKMMACMDKSRLQNLIFEMDFRALCIVLTTRPS